MRTYPHSDVKIGDTIRVTTRDFTNGGSAFTHGAKFKVVEAMPPVYLVDDGETGGLLFRHEFELVGEPEHVPFIPFDTEARD